MPIKIYRVVDCCLVVGQELAITKLEYLIEASINALTRGHLIF